MSYIDDYNQQEFDKIQKRLSREYRRAYANMHAKANEYFMQYDERYWKEYEKYKQGQYTDRQWEAWVQTQIARGRGWDKLKDDMARTMMNTNIIAAAYVNGKTPSIYATNANYMAYTIESDYANVTFDLVDEHTIRNLITEKDNYTEFKTLGVKKGKDYVWNSRQIESALVSGILQGNSIDKMADSFLVVMERSKNAAIRNARTACTSAENAGRLSMLEQAKANGINVRKKWVSGHDARVRDSHAHLDGQIRDIDEPFDNGLMFPADSHGRPEEVYNCRCTLTYIYPKHQSEVRSREEFNRHKKTNETYQEWIKRVQTGGKDYFRIMEEKIKKDSAAEQYYELVIKSSNDIKAIAQASKMSLEDIRQIKEHLFFAEHDLYSGIGKFEPDYDIAVAWKRLREGKPEERDILLLQHELLESTIERTYNVDAAKAHAMASEKYNWQSVIDDMFGLEGEPDGLL